MLLFLLLMFCFVCFPLAIVIGLFYDDSTRFELQVRAIYKIDRPAKPSIAVSFFLLSSRMSHFYFLSFPFNFLTVKLCSNHAASWETERTEKQVQTKRPRQGSRRWRDGWRCHQKKKHTHKYIAHYSRHIRFIRAFCCCCLHLLLIFYFIYFKKKKDDCSWLQHLCDFPIYFFTAIVLPLFLSLSLSLFRRSSHSSSLIRC